MTPVGTPRQFIHYDTERVDYSVTKDELARLERSGTSPWKDLCLVLSPLAISCLINALANIPEPFKVTAFLFLNSVVGFISLVLAIAFGIVWYRNRKSFGDVVEEIKKKPKMELMPSTVNVGALPTGSLTPAGESSAPGNPTS